ncbi:MAG: hypothetical protein GEV03_09130 [Streptosporangiales bacterium]|nr:hypothetical protein [Streptosporangiales bacterium]
MVEWNVTVDFAGLVEPDEAMALDEALAGFEPSVGNVPSRGQFGVTVTSHATDLAGATAEGIAVTARAVAASGRDATPVAVEAMGWDEFSRRVEEPNYPDVVSTVEAAEILGVSRQRVHQLLASHADFPTPLYELGTGKIWTWSAIEAFAKAWDRRPGRPRRTA